MITLVYITLLFFLFPFFFPWHYVSELLMSFLPYLTGIALLFTCISMVYFRKSMRSWYHHIRKYFRGISFITFCVIFFFFSKQFNRFYITEPFSSPIQSWDLTILFANIHKDNVDYTGIQTLISKINPDMLMFVEFADHHYTHLKDFLKQHYPYTNNTTRSKTFVGSMVFGKYPITNKADDFPQGARRYGYFSITYQWNPLYFYLVHTSSPDSYGHFLMRNEQLQTFIHDFQKHEYERTHDAIVIVGDFNITPRSSYYPLLDTTFSGKLINATKRIPFLFTRSLKEFPLFHAHIDHLWATPSLIIPHLEVLPVPWSDHKAFLFSLQVQE